MFSDKLIRFVQEETQGVSMRCEVADDSVVVMKSRPLKASNRPEDKIGMTCGLSTGAAFSQKRMQLRRDEVYLKFFKNMLEVICRAQAIRRNGTFFSRFTLTGVSGFRSRWAE